MFDWGGNYSFELFHLYFKLKRKNFENVCLHQPPYYMNEDLPVCVGERCTLSILPQVSRSGLDLCLPLKLVQHVTRSLSKSPFVHVSVERNIIQQLRGTPRFNKRFTMSWLLSVKADPVMIFH